MPTLRRPRFKPSRAKGKTIRISASSPELEKIAAPLKKTLRQSSDKSLIKKIDKTLVPVLIQGLALGKQRRPTRAMFKSLKSSLFKNPDERLCSREFAIFHIGLEILLGSRGTTWFEVEAICSNFDHDPNPDVASVWQEVKMEFKGDFDQFWSDFADIKTEYVPTYWVALVFWASPRIEQSSAIVGFDDKNMSIVAKRRTSMDTMSTVSIPPPPYSLVDWAETQRLRELMG